MSLVQYNIPILHVLFPAAKKRYTNGYETSNIVSTTFTTGIWSAFNLPFNINMSILGLNLIDLYIKIYKTYIYKKLKKTFLKNNTLFFRKTTLNNILNTNYFTYELSIRLV